MTPTPSPVPVLDANVTTIDPYWAALLPFLIPVLVAVIGSSFLAQIIINVFKNKTTRRQNRRDDATFALEELKRYRKLVIRYGNVEDPEPVDANRDTRIAIQGSNLSVAGAQTRIKGIDVAIEAYLRVGDAFAAQDEFVSAEDEKAKFREVLRLLAIKREKQS